MKKSLLCAQLALAVAVLMLMPSPAQAIDNYVEGLSIHLEDYPTEVRVGETFSMRVKSGEPKRAGGQGVAQDVSFIVTRAK